MKRLSISICLLLFLLTSCSANEEQVTILFLHSWGTMDQGHQMMRGIYEDFMKENPNIKLQLIAMPSSEAVEDKVREMLFVGKVPNLIYTGGFGLDTLYPFMIQEGYLIDMMPYMQQDEEFLESIAQKTWDSFLTEEGELYTVTDTLNLIGYWYNVDMFENAGITELPRTWKELEACCQRIVNWAEGIHYDIVPVNMDAETATYLSAAYMAGIETNGQITEEDFRNMLEELKKITCYSKLMNPDYTDQDNIRSFNTGHCAIYVGGLWMEEKVNETINAAYAPFPSIDGKTVGMYLASPGYLIGNIGDETQKDACVQFVKYMLSEPVQERILKEAGYIPSNEAIEMGQIADQQTRMWEAYQNIYQSDCLEQMPENNWNKRMISNYKEKILDYLTGTVFTEELLDYIKNH